MELCAYKALTAQLAERMAQVPACAAGCKRCHHKAGDIRPSGKAPASCRRAHAPLFLTPFGTPFTTSDVRAFGRRMAAAAGIPPTAVGGKLMRIGGATDLRDVLGEAGQRVIKQRGRWGSDVANVYQRALTRDLLEASALTGDAEAEEMEATLAGWVQPASFR